MNNLYKIGIVLSIFMILAVGATGCVTTTDTTQNINASDKQATTNAGVTVSIKSLGMKPSLGTYIKADDGYTYAVYNATIKNVNAKDRYINEFSFNLRDKSGNVYEVDLGSTAATGAMHAVSKSKPGDVVSGTVAFKVPTGTVPKSITYDDGYDVVTTNL